MVSVYFVCSAGFRLSGAVLGVYVCGLYEVFVCVFACVFACACVSVRVCL